MTHRNSKEELNAGMSALNLAYTPTISSISAQNFGTAAQSAAAGFAPLRVLDPLESDAAVVAQFVLTFVADMMKGGTVDTE